MRRVVGKSDDELAPMLVTCSRREFIYEQPAIPENEYTFKHALTQEVAYGSVLMERRRTLHERTAAALEDDVRGTLDDHLAELAHHYGRSANASRRSIPGAQRSRRGPLGLQRSSRVCAGRNRACSRAAGDGRARAARFNLQNALAGAAMAVEGFGSPVTTQAVSGCSNSRANRVMMRRCPQR